MKFINLLCLIFIIDNNALVTLTQSPTKTLQTGKDENKVPAEETAYDETSKAHDGFAEQDSQHHGTLFSAHWESFKTKHSKLYSNPEEEERRVDIFKENLDKINQHNDLFSKGLKGYSLGINEYADLQHYEFVKVMNGLLARSKSSSSPAADQRVLDRVDYLPPLVKMQIPDTVDWRGQGYVTDVKNQGQCGSCWSFSATGALEGQLFRKSGKLVSLSEQNLVDCSEEWGNHGCNGGLMDYAFQYVKDNHGIDTERSYPYLAEEEPICYYNKSTTGATDLGYKDVVPAGDEDRLKQVLASEGPLSIAIDASQHSFQLYSSGVYDEPLCSNTELDHGVLLVGYGTTQTDNNSQQDAAVETLKGDPEERQDYWIVKNSWGESWGEGGFVRMSRNKDNQCGVASQASFPIM